jgi:outer membrane protein OmpA-like peptidoglycan-associated protein
VLNEVANYLKKYPTAAVKIRCYSDNTGRAETQKALTEKRAQIIKSYLVDFQNISPDRIIAKGFGGDRPVADNNTVSGRALNRRIEMALAIGK